MLFDQPGLGYKRSRRHSIDHVDQYYDRQDSNGNNCVLGKLPFKKRTVRPAMITHLNWFKDEAGIRIAGFLQERGCKIIQILQEISS
jgi:hypothetical protein